MSELSELTRAPRGDVIPGRVLSPLGLIDLGMVEEHFARDHIQIASLAVEGLPKPIVDTAISKAVADVRDGAFNWGAQGFDAHVWSSRMVPYLLWVSLRVADPKITRDEARAIINRENGQKIHYAILELMGYPVIAPGEKPKKKDGNQPPDEPTGNPSSVPSENAG